MITKTVTVYEFTDEDKKLLNTPLPPNPCDSCNSMDCGSFCRKQDNYDMLVNPYRIAGVYDIAVNISRIRAINEEIRRLEMELDKANKAIPDEVRSFIEPKMFE